MLQGLLLYTKLQTLIKAQSREYRKILHSVQILPLLQGWSVVHLLRSSSQLQHERTCIWGVDWLQSSREQQIKDFWFQFHHVSTPDPSPTTPVVKLGNSNAYTVLGFCSSTATSGACSCMATEGFCSSTAIAGACICMATEGFSTREAGSTPLGEEEETPWPTKVGDMGPPPSYECCCSGWTSLALSV